MNVVVTTWAAHLDHIHHVLRIGVLLLPQVEHFEFLPDWRFMASRLNIAERAERLLGLTVLFRVGEALVLFDLCESLLLFETEFNVVERFI